MIPDFKTYLKESVWMDIHRRSNGDQERKEDDINNLDLDEFYQYLKSRYDNEFWAQNVRSGADWKAMDIMLFRLPNTFPGLVVYSFDNGERLDFRFFAEAYHEAEPIIDFVKNMPFNVKTSSNVERLHRRIYEALIKPQDNSKVTNTFIIEVLEYILKNFKRPSEYKDLMKPIK